MDREKLEEELGIAGEFEVRGLEGEGVHGEVAQVDYQILYLMAEIKELLIRVLENVSDSRTGL